MTYQLLGVGDVFLHGFVLLLGLFESVRVVSVEDFWVYRSFGK